MTDFEADQLITEIKELQEEQARFRLIAKQKGEEILRQLEAKETSIESHIQFLKSQLQAFFVSTENKKQTKTQESYNLLSGKLVMKKPTLKLEHDDKKLLDYALNYSELAYVQYTPKFNWSAFKDDLEVNGTTIINRLTGEVLEGIEGLSVMEVPEAFDIK